jgi:hypothetical protein
MRTFLLFSVLLLSVSCKQKQENTTFNKPGADSLSKEPLYPYPQYILEQIQYVDSAPLAIEMHTFENGARIDSVLITREKFHELAAEFHSPDLNSAELRPLYTEKSFQDLSINSITFSIAANDANLVIQQADILLDPESQKVKNIIIKKAIATPDSSENRTLLWVNNMNFQIISSVTKNGRATIDRVTKVIWDKPRD